MMGDFLSMNCFLTDISTHIPRMRDDLAIKSRNWLLTHF